MTLASRCPRVGVVAAVATVLISAAGSVVAAPPNPADGALQETSWFDPERGDLVPVEVESTRVDTAHRASHWEQQPQPTAGGSTGPTPGPPFRLFGLSLGQLFAWVLLATILAVLVSLLVYAFMKADIDLGPVRARRGGGLDHSSDEAMAQRVQQLPTELGRSGASDWRSESQRAMREGRFERAIVFLFGHQLLLLDRAGILRLSRGKTNRRYLHEARREDPPSAEHLLTTVMLFERTYFGRHEITAEQFAAVWQRNEQLERRVQERQEVAA